MVFLKGMIQINLGGRPEMKHVRVTGDGKKVKNQITWEFLFPVQHPAWGGEKGVSKDLVSVEFEVYGQGTRGNRSITYEFTAQDGSHKFKVKGIS